MAPHSSTLAWKIPWTEEPGVLQSMGSLRVGHDWVTSLSLFTLMHWRRKWQPTPVFLPGESQGRGSLVGCRLWGRTESETTEVTWQQQQQCIQLIGQVQVTCPRHSCRRAVLEAESLRSRCPVWSGEDPLSDCRLVIESSLFWIEFLEGHPSVCSRWISRQECWILSQFFFFFLLSSLTFKRFFISSFSAIRVVSSAYLRLLIFLPAILIPSCTSSNLAFHMMYSAYKLTKQDDNIQLFCTLFPIWNQSVVACPVLTVAFWPAYKFLRRQVRWSGIPISWRIFQFVVIHIVRNFSVVNKAEVDVFLEFSCFLYDPMDIGNLIS